MSDEFLVNCDEDGIATITLNRPESMNAITDGMFRGLYTSLKELERDPGVKALILTGAGRAFSAGGDVKQMKGSASTLTFEDRVEALRQRHELAIAMYEFPRVTIAAVNGVAAGAASALALACDFRIGTPNTSFITGFVGVGFSGDFGGTYFLSKIVGPDKAKALFLSSERVTAESAKDLGLISEIVEIESILEEAKNRARHYASGALLAHNYIKKNFRALDGVSLRELLDVEAVNQIRLATSEDHTEAIRAFAEKRKPQFKGR